MRDDNFVSYDTKPIQEYDLFQQAYDYFNDRLFAGQLPPCLITLQRKKGAYGYFSGDRFESRTNAETTTDEIAMNPAHFHQGDLETLDTLVHEMCHLWQHHFGKISRGGYHNKEWATKMLDIGLTPSSTGKPGGKMTGQKVSDFITPGGLFESEARGLLGTGFTFRWQSRESTKGKNGGSGKNKTKYTCPDCGQNAWGKPGARLICGDCNQPMEHDE